jgi:integrase
MNAPSFIEQRRIEGTIGDALKRTILHASGREPTEAELEFEVKSAFRRMAGSLEKGVPALPGGEGGVPPQAAAAGIGTWLNPEQIKEAEAAFWYAGTQGIRSVVEALRWYRSHGGAFHNAPTIEECLEEFLVGRRAKGCTVATIKGYVHGIGKFAAMVPKRRPSEVTTHEIAQFVAAPKHPTTRACRWRIIFTFYKWCVGQGYVAENPVPRAMDKPIRRPGASLVFTPAEARELLHRAKNTDQLGFWVLALFAGIRTHELRRLQAHPYRWSLVRPTVIEIPHEISKMWGRRIPVMPVLKPWIEWMRKHDIPIFPIDHFRKTHQLKNLVLGPRINLLAEKFSAMRPDDAPPHWTYNIARRSFISYRMALAGASYASLSHEVGNTETVIRNYYYRHVTAKAAKAYFSLTPDRV